MDTIKENQSAVYTVADWNRDQGFGAKPGQEISEEIYEQMLNCIPPRTLPRETAQMALDSLNIPVHAGFLMGEPHSCDKQGQLYLAFGKNDYGKGKHFFYLGLSHAAKPLPNGTYYFFDTLNALQNDGLVKATKYTGDKKAIAFAIDSEATLYKRVYRNGRVIEETLLYEPICQ